MKWRILFGEQESYSWCSQWIGNFFFFFRFFILLNRNIPFARYFMPFKYINIKLLSLIFVRSTQFFPFPLALNALELVNSIHLIMIIDEIKTRTKNRWTAESVNLFSSSFRWKSLLLLVSIFSHQLFCLYIGNV